VNVDDMQDSRKQGKWLTHGTLQYTTARSTHKY